MIVVRQLGNGGAFSPNKTNTSFTLFDDTILVDCGYNVFRKLEKPYDIANKIRFLLITHDHDDHFGSAGTFIYFKEFALRSPLYFYAPTIVANRYFEVINYYGRYSYPADKEDFWHVKHYPSDSWKELKVEIENELSSHVENPQVDILVQDSHGIIENASYRFKFEADGKRYAITISGDTKANRKLMDFAYTDAKVDYWMLFHDFQIYDTVNSIHATSTEFNQLYSEFEKAHIVRVHTDEDDYKEIWTLEDVTNFCEEANNISW